MKKLRIIALVMAILMVASFAFACTSEGEGETTTTKAATTTTTTKTLPVAPGPTTGEDEPDPETPVRAEEFVAWKDTFDPVTVIGYTSDHNPWDDGPVEYLFDGLDGFLNTDADATKIGGGTNGGQVTITIDVAPGTKLTAYAFVTGKDCVQWKGRTPGEWYVYGSNVAPDAATEDDWKLVDYVYDGATEEVDSEPFGYTVDADKAAAYNHYKFEFVFGIEGTLGAFQLNELYLYTDKATA